jgi:hypothetical protein
VVHGVNLLLEIVKLEQPIHKDELYDRYRLCYGLDGTSKYQRQQFNRVLLSAVNGKKLIEENYFIQLPQFDHEITPRSPQNGESPRRIERISLDEISALLIQVANHVYGISLSALIREVSALFGYPNASTARKERIEKALNELIKLGLVQLSGDSVVPTKKKYNGL